MSVKVPIVWQEEKAKLRRWRVSVGETVYEGQELAEMEPLNLSSKSICKQKGTIRELLVPNGSTLESGQTIAILDLCPHTNVHLGLCYGCGLDIKVQSVTEGKMKQIEINKRLTAQKKLSLILDLDHTLLHATVGAPLAKLPQVDNLFPFKLDDSPFQYYVKLRPFLEEFLKEAVRYYEIYIYTMGSYTYAQKIVQIISEACHLGTDFFISNRIVTRDHTKNEEVKDLRALFPTDDTRVMIIDDNSQVWTHHSENLIKIAPFVFFISGVEINTPAFNAENEKRKKELEEKAKASEKEEGKEENKEEGNDSAENAVDDSESKKRARDDNEEELPASKRVKLSDDSASSSSDEVSTHSSDADIDAEDNQEDHEDGENGNGTANGQEEHQSTMVAASDEDASGSADDIEVASVLEEDAPCIHPEKEEVVKDVEGNVLPTKKSDDDAGAAESVTPVKVTADQEQTLAQTELKFLEHSLNDTCLLSVLSLLKNVHASYYNTANENTDRDVKKYLGQAKSNILKGAHIVFSHVFPRDSPPERQEIWIMAERLGAKCQTDFTSRTTHVIARVKGTDKVRQALTTPGVYLVREEWLARCYKFWRHEPEELYPLADLPVQSVPNKSNTNALINNNSNDSDVDLESELAFLEQALNDE